MPPPPPPAQLFLSPWEGDLWDGGGGGTSVPRPASVVVRSVAKFLLNSGINAIFPRLTSSLFYT